MAVLKMKKHKLLNVLIGLGFISLLACTDQSRTTTIQDNINQAEINPDNGKRQAAKRFVAELDISNSIIPYPNNILFSGTEDGTLNIPVEDANDYSSPQVALNTLDGFSTIAPMSLTFNDSIDANSIIPGSNIRIFEVSLNEQNAIVSINLELDVSDFTATVSSVDVTNRTLVIIPLKPLKPKTSYLVSISNSIKNIDDIPAQADTLYDILKSESAIVEDGEIQFAAFNNPLLSAEENLENATRIDGLRKLTRISEQNIAAFTTTLDTDDTITDLTSENIILSWSFTTQSTSDVIQHVYDSVQNTNPVSKVNQDSTIPSPLNRANIHVGTLDVPYYLSAPDDTNPLAATNRFWQGANETHLTKFNPAPTVTSTQTIPLLLAIPNSSDITKPDDGWPIVIFLHGITSNRSALLGIADALASTGVASIAIDLPLHGLLGDEVLVGSLKDASTAFNENVKERHFFMDLLDNTSALPGPDGNIDNSGAHFINLQSLLTSRDNVRQGIVDLFVLTKALESMDINNDDAGDFDPNKIFFIGHSLGAIVGASFLNFETKIRSAVLFSPASGIAKTVDNSASFGPRISDGLASVGVLKGTSDFESFMNAMQTGLDSVDPINFTDNVSSDRSILVYEFIGGNGSSADLVIPNNVTTQLLDGTVPSPTAGTDPLATLLNLVTFNNSQQATDPTLRLWAKLVAGHHSSPLSPSEDTASGNTAETAASVTQLIQMQVAEFIASAGRSVTVNDPDNLMASP